jgi:hypothetical protein
MSPFEYVKDEYDPVTQEVIPRKYFSGGADLKNVMIERTDRLPFSDKAATVVTAEISPVGDKSVAPSTITLNEAEIWRRDIVTKNIKMVPRGFWQSKEVAKVMIITALYTVPGFREAHQKKDIAAMAQLYRTYVIAYKSINTKMSDDGKRLYDNGQKAFFAEVGGLWGLMNNKKEYFNKTSSPAELLRLAVPELIDLTNPDALDPLEVEHNYWTDEKNAKYHILQALDTVPGFKTAREADDIGTMANLYRKYVKGYVAKDLNKYRTKQGYQVNAATAFFYEVGGLQGLMSSSGAKYFSKSKSPAELLRVALPELVDQEDPLALRFEEIEHAPKRSGDKAMVADVSTPVEGAEWIERKSSGKIKYFPRGFWESKETARNMILPTCRACR